MTRGAGIHGGLVSVVTLPTVKLPQMRVMGIRSLFIFSCNIHLLKKLIKRKFQEAFWSGEHGKIEGGPVVWDEGLEEVWNCLDKFYGRRFG
jgi:hypothetical protein